MVHVGARFLCLTAVAVWLACSSTPATSRFSASVVTGELGRRLDQLLSTAADSGFSGVVLIVREGRPLLHKGYGFADRERTVPVTVATPFWIVSVSKQFAAAAVLKLVEQGELSLGDTLGRLLEEVPADKREITIHQLLTHTAGLAERDAADGVADRNAAIREILAVPLARPPGSDYGYTNVAYNLLAAIIEIVTEEPYEAYVRRMLLEPAGLRQTGFWGPSDHPEVAAILPVSWGNPSVLRANWGYRGARGMYSTAADLYAWSIALREHRLLSPSSVERMFRAHVMARSAGVGYTWFVTQTPRGTRSLWTRGNQGSGHGAVLAVFPDERVVLVVVSNTDRYSPGVPMGHALAADLAETVFGSP